MIDTSRIFLTFIFTIVGVFLFENLSIGLGLVLFLIILFVYFFSKSKNIILAAIIGIILGFGSTVIGVEDLSESLSKLVGQKISGTAIIESSKQNAFGFQYLSKVNINNENVKALIEINDARKLAMGDRINFSGTLTLPENFISEYNKTFDYNNYLRSKGVLLIIKNAKWSDKISARGFSLSRILDSIKLKFESSLEKTLHEPAASLSEGMLIGDKGTMTSQDSDSFRKSGLIHMVVLSGYNISVIAAFVLAIFMKAGRKISLISAATVIILFVLLTGASATAVRAGIMGVLVILGNLAHRKLDILRLLSITGVVMIMISPLAALYDPSFQLSFLATFGLIAFAPMVTRKIYFVTEKFGLREIIAATLGCQIMTLPYLASSIGAVSIVSIFANVLVLPLAPLLMFFGFATGITFLTPVIGKYLYLPFSFLTQMISTYVFKISNFFAALPFSMVSTSLITGWLIVLFYIPLTIYGFKLYKQENLNK